MASGAHTRRYAQIDIAGANMNMHMYMYIYICIYKCICVYRERERSSFIFGAPRRDGAWGAARRYA